MISSLHVAAGALAGAAAGSRGTALALAPLLHFALDVIPHEDIDSHPFEIATSCGSIAALAVVHGPVAPATIGGAVCALPDLEHVLRLPRPGGRKLFPSHWSPGRHEGPRVPAWAQLAVAGALLAAVLKR